MRAGRLPDLGRQLDAGRTGADDHDVHSRRPAGRCLRVRAHAGGQQPAVKALGVRERVERNCIRRNARHTEVVADAADTEDQRVVAHRAAREHQRAVVVVDGIERKLMPRAVQAGHGSLPEPEVMPVREREIIDAVNVGIQTPGRDFVQQRLPQMRRIAIDQRDLGAPAPSQLVAEARRQRQSAGVGLGASIGVTRPAGAPAH